MNNTRTVLTIATGKPVFVDLAVNLARSFHFWNANAGINFLLVTDMPALVPPDVLKFISILEIGDGELGHGFSTKLHLDAVAPDGQTLFIDSDCLIYGPIDWIFDTFQGNAVSVCGSYISDGEWFGDVKAICQRLKLEKLPKFNGGIYYIEKGEKSAAIYETARALEKHYDEIGFVRLRNRPNDEVLMAAAMEIHQQQPVKDDGKMMSDPQACKGYLELNVLTGKVIMTNPLPPSPLHTEWYEHTQVSPSIVHFLGYYTSHYPYRMDSRRLRLVSKNRFSLMQELVCIIGIKYPQVLSHTLKKKFRPLFRSIFGVRRIKRSERI